MKTKLKLSQALPLAEKIRGVFDPACERIEIAGSVWRRKPIVGDIEFVIIPKMYPELPSQLSLLDEEEPKMVSALDMLVEKLIAEKPHLRWGNKNGDRYKNFLVQFNSDGSEIGLDLLLTTSDQWDYIFALRTELDDFNKAWITGGYPL